jgi:ribose transport system ATP-binding protein
LNDEVAGDAPALVMAHVSKSFGGAKALDDVTLTVGRCEVHGLLGQNGSGKSTLIKILSGFHAPDAGELEIFGVSVPLPLTPGRFKSLGLAFVHQHLGLLPSLTVLENLRIGAFASGAKLINWRKERLAARETLRRFDLAIDPDALVESLPAVERAMVGIVRAFEDLKASRGKSGAGGVLVLDEPTPFLPRSDVERLFALVRRVVAEGASVILVSHDIDEIMEVTDHVTVLRNGRVAGTIATREATREAILQMIVGRRVESYRMDRAASAIGGDSIHIDALVGGALETLSLTLKPGEIVGLTGLIGSGYASVPYLLFGDVAARGGTLTIGGKTLKIANIRPDIAQRCGLAFLPGDRLAQAGVGSLSVTDNLTLSFLDQFVTPTGLDRGAMRRTALRLGREHDVRPNDPDLALESLSGGNQQKVLLAKWLHRAPALLLLDEPTQGVDFGARQQIFGALDVARRQGAAILCASTDYDQLEQICDRVLVFHRGIVAAELQGENLTKHRIARACYESAEPGFMREAV